MANEVAQTESPRPLISGPVYREDDDSNLLHLDPEAGDGPTEKFQTLAEELVDLLMLRFREANGVDANDPRLLCGGCVGTTLLNFVSTIIERSDMNAHERIMYRERIAERIELGGDPIRTLLARVLSGRRDSVGRDDVEILRLR